MVSETIDRRDVIDLFHSLMEPDSEFRVLRLVGEAKMGKTHLVSKVYPQLAERVYHVPCAVLDLRDRSQTPIDLMEAACTLLGGYQMFPKYWTAHQTWHRPSPPLQSKISAVFSRVMLKAPSEHDDWTPAVRDMTCEFAADIGDTPERPVLLLVDQIDDADRAVVGWLVNRLLVHLCAHMHVRVVLAGQDVPNPCSTYLRICRSHELQRITETQPYVEFCRELGLDLDEESVPAMVEVARHAPGNFADLVLSTFSKREVRGG